MKSKKLHRPGAWYLGAMAFGTLFLLSLLVAGAPTALAQTKKKDDAKAEPKDVRFIQDIMVSTFGGLEQVQAINETVTKSWKENKITPSDRCSDYEFIRRASLDIIGRIATVAEIDRFMKDAPDRRRSLLIERLLGNEKGNEKYAEEYANNFANVWTVLLMTRSGASKMYQEQMHLWLLEKLMETSKGGSGADWSKIVIDILSASGKTNENGAVNYLLTHLGEEFNQKGDTAKNGRYDLVPVTSRTTRLFLGLRIQCAQCHDHPFNNDFKQKHFWGINAFFRQVDTPMGRPTMMKGKKGAKDQPQLEVLDRTNFNSRALVSYEPRSAILLYEKATFIDGKQLKEVPSDSTRRKELAKHIVGSPWFAKAYVNRLWGHFMGKSFCPQSPDDFHENNAPSFPDLLDKLGDDWAKKYQHNPKDMIRWICNSLPYQLSSVANKTNDAPEVETQFSRMLLKAMTPEQMFESLVTASQAKLGQVKEDKRKKMDEWMNKLVSNFGDDEGNESTYTGTVVQALMLMNGQDINDFITDKEQGTVANVLKKRAFSATAARDAAKDLYLAALNRPPRADEYTRILNPKTFNLPKSPLPKSPQQQEQFWTGYYQDLFWAILNSGEFILNH